MQRVAIRLGCARLSSYITLLLYLVQLAYPVLLAQNLQNSQQHYQSTIS